jgi:hypothetical protein
VSWRSADADDELLGVNEGLYIDFLDAIERISIDQKKPSLLSRSSIAVVMV